jgi:hypothetical protein
MKILTSLLVNDGKLLRKETADQFFQPQLTAESKAAQKALFQDPEKLKLFIGDFPSDVEYDWGLGGILVQSEGRTRRFKGTMIWSGMPNLFWVISRKTEVKVLIADISSSLTGQEDCVVLLACSCCPPPTRRRRNL